MKKTKVFFLLAAMVIGLGASSCHSKKNCPAYTKALSSNRHRV